MPIDRIWSPELAHHTPPVDHAQPTDRLTTEQHVLGDRQVGHHAQFLVNHTYARRARIARGSKPHFATIDPHRAVELDMHAGYDFHQGALARPVLANEAVDFPGAQSEVDIRQRVDAAERLRNADEFEQGS